MRMVVLGEDVGVFVVHQAKSARGEAMLGRVLGGASEALVSFRASAEATVGCVVVRDSRLVKLVASCVWLNHTT